MAESWVKISAMTDDDIKGVNVNRATADSALKCIQARWDFSRRSRNARSLERAASGISMHTSTFIPLS